MTLKEYIQWLEKELIKLIGIPRAFIKEKEEEQQ